MVCQYFREVEEFEEVVVFVEKLCERKLSGLCMEEFALIASRRVQYLGDNEWQTYILTVEEDGVLKLIDRRTISRRRMIHFRQTSNIQYKGCTVVVVSNDKYEGHSVER